MPIISKGGRRGWKSRVIFLLMYAVLAVGALMMLYPFALMVGGSLCTGYDFDDFAVVPRYLYDDNALAKKRLFDKYGQNSFQSLAFQYGRDSKWINWDDVRAEKDFLRRVYAAEAKKSAAEAEDWFTFKKSIPPAECGLYFEKDLKYYQEFLRKRYHGNIAGLNRKWGRSFNRFEEVRSMVSMLFDQRWYPP